MEINILKKIRQVWLKRRAPKQSSGGASFRPCFEKLEDRIVPTTRTWTGGSILSNDWSDQFNWQNGVPQNGDSVFFPANAKQRTNDQDIGSFFDDRGVLLDTLHIEGGDYDIRGPKDIFVQQVSSDAGANKIRADLDYAGELEFTLEVTAGTLSLTGVSEITDQTNVTFLQFLAKTGAGTLAISGRIGNNNAFDEPNFAEFRVRQGLVSMEVGGQLQTNLRIFNGSTVRLQQGGDQISSSVVKIDAGGVMDLNGHSEGLGTLTVNGAITTGAAGTLLIEGDVTTSSSTTAVISGRVDLGGTSSTNRTFNVVNGSATDDLFIDGVIQGAAKLIKDGGGRLKLTGTSANTYTGLTQVKAGVLSLAKFDNVNAIAGDLLIGDSTGNDNDVRVLVSADEQISTSSLVRVNASGLLDLQGHTETFGALILAGNVTSGSTGLLELSGDVATESVARMPTISGRLSLQNGPRTFNVVDAVTGTDLTVDAVIVDGALIKVGAGTMLMSGANTYTGSTTVNQGTLVLGKLGTPIINGSLIIGDGDGGADADKVVLQFSNQIADGAAVTVNASGLLDTSNFNEKIGPLTLVGGHVNSGTALLTPTGDITAAAAPTMAIISGRLDNSQRNIFVDNSVSGTDLLIDAVITTGGITKTGPGTLELTANNTYAFTTIISEGQVAVNGSINSLVLLNGGTLLGSGTVKGVNTLAPGGKVQPGDGFGTLTSNGDFRLLNGASFQPQILPLAPDPHDVLKVQGTVDLTGATLAVQPFFLPGVPPPIPVLIDDSSTNSTSTAGFSVFSGAGFNLVNNNDRFAAGVVGGAEQVVWNFQGLQPGSYRVSATWGPGASNRATNAPYTIQNGGAPDTTVLVNQQVAAADFSKLGFSWHPLAIVQVTTTSVTVRLTNNANGFVIADAILLEPRQVVIIDNDGTDPVVGNFANLPEGSTVSAVAVGVVNGQIVQQTQLYTISYHANDGNDVGLGYITTATAAQNLLITPATINEGGKATLTGHLTDPDAGDFLTLTIAWGDGATETHHPGTADFAFTHRYLNNPAGQPHGAYTVHLTWFDQHNAGNSRDLAVTVHNVAPTIFLPTQVAVRGGGMLTVPGYFTDPGVLDHWTATVDFGDGTGVQTLKVNRAGLFLLRHRYERPGTYHVTVKVTDDDGEFGLATMLVRVDSVKGKASGKS